MRIKICMCAYPSVLSNTTMENITSNFSMECGTYEQLGYWPNNFDDFAVSIKNCELHWCVLYELLVLLFSPVRFIFVKYCTCLTFDCNDDDGDDNELSMSVMVFLYFCDGLGTVIITN